MVLTRLRADRYRNIVFCDLSFDPGVNLLFGDNAQGKTNALECIYFFARGKSFRPAQDAELVRFGETGFSCEINFFSNDREQSLYYGYENGVRLRKKNGVKLNRATEMLGHFRAVLFYPEHLNIVKGGPGERRDFLNVAIAQHDPAYLLFYNEYNKILDNRNYLLKTAQKGGYTDPSELEAWSEKMAEVAAEILIRRKQYVAGLSPFAADILTDLSSEKEKMTLTYLSDTEADTREDAINAYRKLFSENVKREIAAGCSLFGIHRDDLGIEIGGNSARLFASQGQQRSAVLSLKLAEGEYSRALSGEYPVFLFDDVLSELDGKRREYVLKHTEEKQIILTCCEREGLGGDFHEIRVSGGTYVSSHR